MGLTHEFVTNSIERSPWWKANSSSASQDIPKILWISNVHCRVHKSQLRVRIINQLNPGQSTHTNFYKIQFSINLLSTPPPSQVSISCRRTHQNLLSSPTPVPCSPTVSVSFTSYYERILAWGVSDKIFMVPWTAFSRSEDFPTGTLRDSQ